MNTPTDTTATLALRSDLQIIAEWIQPGNHILDLGCGDGSLMGYLDRTKSVTGYGIEIEDHYIPQCIRNGVNVLQMDLDRGLTEFNDNSFDQVILSMALQTMRYPHLLMEEMLRVGREALSPFLILATGKFAGTWQDAVGCRLAKPCPTTGTTPPIFTSVPCRTLKSSVASTTFRFRSDAR
jgi:methionine biosynthesis protein MetW